MDFLVSRREYGGSPLNFRNTPSKKPSYLCVTVPRVSSTSDGFPIPQSEWIRKVKKSSKNGQILVVVHGFNVKQKSFLYEVSKIRKTIQKSGYKGGVVGFDWPSDGSPFRYTEDEADAEAIADGLVKDTILPLIRHGSGTQITILAHSMGALVVSRALQKAVQRGEHTFLRKAIKEVVLTSADFDRDHFKAGGWALAAFQNYKFRFTNYWSFDDEVLRDRENWIGVHTDRLGRNPSPLQPSRTHDAVDCTEYYQNTHSGPGDYRKSHSFYYNDGVFYADLIATLTGAPKGSRPFRSPAAGGHQKLSR